MWSRVDWARWWWNAWARIVVNWVYGGALAGLLLLFLSPLAVDGRPQWFGACFLLLPVYMVHQFEEHDGDRFRLFVNRSIGQGKEVLTPMAIFVINVPGVWGVIALSLLAAWYWRPGIGLIAIYLALVNAVLHVGQMLASRRYNPGVGTAVVLLLPFGGFALVEIVRAGVAGWKDHVVGLAMAMGIHAGIVGYVEVRKLRLG